MMEYMTRKGNRLDGELEAPSFKPCMDLSKHYLFSTVSRKLHLTGGDECGLLTVKSLQFASAAGRGTVPPGAVPAFFRESAKEFSGQEVRR